MRVNPSSTHRFSWIWVVPAVLIVAAAFVHAAPAIAVGIGFAAGLSLARSV